MSRTGYANGTTVSAEKSRGEIEQLVQKYAGRDADFSYGRMGGNAGISFVAKGRRVQFAMPMPSSAEADAGAKRKGSWRTATAAQRETWLEQETRRRWRCLLLIIKAKFAAVEIWEELGDKEKAKTAFEREFLSDIVTPSGPSIYDAIQRVASDGLRLLPAVESGAKVLEIGARKP